MNRIILIGNGFDLAHGLETKYEHFIKYLWRQIIEDLKKNDNNKMVSIVDSKGFSYDSSFFKNETNLDTILSYKEFCSYLFEYDLSIKFNNKFLEIISKALTLNNWVDIELEYYKELKNIISNASDYYRFVRNNTSIEKLNDDFEEIKKALETYLTILTYDKTRKPVQRKDNLFESIYSNFEVKDLTNYGTNEYAIEKYYEYEKGLANKESEMLKFQQFLDDKGVDVNRSRNIIEEIKEEISRPNVNFFDLSPRNILLLNFNYTNTDMLYDKNKTQTIHIHGQLQNSVNPIIFGYGDENDELHQQIENLGGRYLDNVKTINYSRKRNYKNLLDFIEGGLYQVFIMGHSCGMSDKTLLKTLFEHKNCVSIKPFYYIDNEGHNNYDDLIKNIYRIFSDKALMRAKVVNQDDCEEI